MGRLGVLLTAVALTLLAVSLYFFTPSTIQFNAFIGRMLFSSPSLTNIFSYLATVAEYLFGWHVFKKILSWLSNELKGNVELLIVKGGESPLSYRFSRRVQREIPTSAKVIWRLTGWRHRKIALAVLNREPVKLKTMFRQWWIQVREGGVVIGGGELTKNMLNATNWVAFLKRKIIRAKHLCVIGGLGGSHGSTVLASSSTSDLISALGCKLTTFVIFSTQDIMQMRQKAENLRIWQRSIIENVESPLFTKSSLKLLLDFEGKEEEEICTNDVVEFLTALYLHYSAPTSGTKGDDLINVALNLSSRFVTLYWIRKLSTNPEILAQEIPEKFKVLGEKIHLHPSTSQTDIHVPPTIISPLFANESACIFRNPQDSDVTAEARESNVEKALDGLNQKNKLRMFVRMNLFETPDLLLLIPLKSQQLINGLWWCDAFPEAVLRKITAEELTPGVKNEVVKEGRTIQT